jgi:hypothetical protein
MGGGEIALLVLFLGAFMGFGVILAWASHRTHE